MLTAILVLAGLVAPTTIGIRPLDFVMADTKCWMVASSFDRPDSPINFKAATLSHLCSRGGDSVTCKQRTTDRSDQTQEPEVTYTVTDAPPRMFLTGTASQITIFVDWSRGTYLLSSMSIDVDRGGMFSKQCVGQIAPAN